MPLSMEGLRSIPRSVDESDFFFNDSSNLGEAQATLLQKSADHPASYHQLAGSCQRRDQPDQHRSLEREPGSLPESIVRRNIGLDLKSSLPFQTGEIESEHSLQG